MDHERDSEMPNGPIPQDSIPTSPVPMNPTRSGSGLRRASLVLSIVSGLLMVSAAVVLVSISLGEFTSTSVDDKGVEVTVSGRTPSILQDSPQFAVMWVAVAIVVAVCAGLAVRHGRTVGPVAVIVVSWLMTIAAMLSIGIFFLPATVVMGASCVLALIDRGSRAGNDGRVVGPAHH